MGVNFVGGVSYPLGNYAVYSLFLYFSAPWVCFGYYPGLFDI